MEDVVKQMIEENGRMWGKSLRRPDVPVLVTDGRHEPCPLYELTYMANEPELYWRIDKRYITVEEAEEINAFLRECEMKVIGSIFPPREDCESMQVRAYVKNGRCPGWNLSVNRVRVAIERVPWAVE